MKKIFIKIIGLSAIIMLLVSASKPSIEGRAIVADQGELPPGLYIKAATFLPGDTVVITNPATKISLEVMVFGTFNASEGFAAILSPDVAKQLYISKDSNSIVQITKTGANTESIILNRPLTSPTVVPPADFIDDSEPYVEEKKPEPVATIAETPVLVEEFVAIIAEVAVPAEEPVATIAETLVPTEEPVATIAETPVPAEEENIEDAVVFTPFSNMEDVYPITQPTTDKVVTELYVQDMMDGLTPELLPEEDDITEAFHVQKSVEELMPELIPTPLPEEDDITEAFHVQKSIEELMPELIPELPPKDVVIADELLMQDLMEALICVSSPEEVVIADEPLFPNMTEEVVPEWIPELLLEEVPNVLISAENYPPELAIETDLEVESLPDFFIYEEPSVMLIPQEETIETETVENDPLVFDSLALVSVVEETLNPLLIPSVMDYIDIEEYIRKYEVDSIQSFGKGNFCIQLATYKDMDNIEKVISAYADKYPVRLVKSETIPDAYQVVIGPLNKDEYTIVLQRFASWGFESAFLRPIN